MAFFSNYTIDLTFFLSFSEYYNSVFRSSQIDEKWNYLELVCSNEAKREAEAIH